jgi:hypothetical protein
MFIDHTCPVELPLNELPARRRGPYLQTEQQITSAGFEPAKPAIKWFQNYALDHKTTGIIVNFPSNC